MVNFITFQKIIAEKWTKIDNYGVYPEKNWYLLKMREADALIQLETLEIKILKNLKAKKWMTTSPFFKRKESDIKGPWQS